MYDTNHSAKLKKLARSLKILSLKSVIDYLHIGKQRRQSAIVVSQLFSNIAEFLMMRLF